ncbi:Serine/threonine protein kinase (fragment) [Candidatus Sulfopaludibacter sp. SbA4]
MLYTGTLGSTTSDDSEILVLNLKTGQSKLVYRGGYNARYLPSGHLVYVRQGSLFGLRFDPSRLESRGLPVRLVDDVAANLTSGGADFAVSRTGTLVYHAGKTNLGIFPMVWIDSSGKTTPLISKPDSYLTPRLSPDGRFLAVAIPTGGGPDLHVWDIQRQTLSPLTFNRHANMHPVWTPDSRHLVFESQWNGSYTLWWARADGASEPRKLLESNTALVTSSMSPDGRRVAYYQVSADTGSDIWTLPLDLSDPENPKPGTPEPFLRTPSTEGNPAFSPDGRWIAYSSDESRRFEIYVRPFPPGPGKWEISRDGGNWARFTRDGKQLFYEAADGHIMVVDYQAKGVSFLAGNPRRWTESPIYINGTFAHYDVAPDGKRIVAFQGPAGGEEKGSVHVTLMLNFFDELKRRMP